MFFGRMPSDAPAALKGVERLAQATTLSVSVDKGIGKTRYWNPVDLLERGDVSRSDLRDLVPGTSAPGSEQESDR